MRMVPLATVLAGTLIGIALGTPTEFYATKYDSLDIEMILNNRRMVNHYAACMLSKGPCPPEGLEFRRILPEALKTNCRRCTEKQKAVILHAIRRLQKEYPKVWSQFQYQWDPTDVYVKKFEETFGSYDYEPLPLQGDSMNKIDGDDKRITIKLRTAELDDDDQDIPPIPRSTTTTTRSIISAAPSIVITTKTALAPSTTKKITTTTSKTTNRPITFTSTFNPIRLPALPLPPVPNIGASIEATVSFGNDVVGGLVKSIGAIGNRVIETGAEIADVVLKSISKPL